MTKMTKTKKTSTPKIPADLAEVLARAMADVDEENEYDVYNILNDNAGTIKKYLQELPSRKIVLELNPIEIGKICKALSDDPCIGEPLAKKILDALK